MRLGRFLRWLRGERTAHVVVSGAGVMFPPGATVEERTVIVRRLEEDGKIELAVADLIISAVTRDALRGDG